MNGSIKHSNSPSLSSRALSSGGLSAPVGLIVADCEFQSATRAFSRGDIDLIKAENAHRLTWRSHCHIDDDQIS